MLDVSQTHLTESEYTMSINKNAALFLSDGTPVTFVKTTSRGNYQVKLPDSHAFAAGQDAGRIFRPDGSHYKNATSLTLTNDGNVPVAADVTDAGAVSGKADIDTSAPLVLSDGTPVTFVKRTKKGRIQVRLPDSHPFAAGQENGRIFFRNSGKHFKGHTDLVLSNGAADSASTSTLAATPVATSGSNFGIVTDTGSMLGDGYASFDDAARAATTMLGDNSPLSIVEITTKVVGSVSATVTRS